jgi:hypothetical protein
MIFYAFVAVMSSLVMLYIIDCDSDDRFIDQDFETQFSVSFVMIVLGVIWPVSLPFLSMFFGFRYISKWKKDNGK